MSVSRRSFTFGATGAALLPFLPAPALARAPKATAQAPGFFRTMIGDLEVTALADGFIELGADLFSGDPVAAELLGAPKVRTSVNGWLINTGDRLVLVDTGTSTAMGDTLGKLAANLGAAGYTPDQVDDVVITHLHIDHANGLLNGDNIAFPNASLRVAESELAFWSDDALRNQAPDGLKPFFDIARRAVKPYQAAGKLVSFSDGELLPGITAIAAPGHTPGHSMLRLSSGKAGLLIWGDIVHNAALQFPEPARTISFDIDPDQAAATRLRVFDLAAADKVLVAGSHLPFPGLGYVTKAAGVYRYVAEPWKPVP
jgi:glyoxylase-like metal-dependent hydrolase (beta-lactamase superfamily II)